MEELLLLLLALFRVKVGGGGAVDPNFYLHISFIWVEISLHFEFHLLGVPRSGRFTAGDNKKTNISIDLMASLASSSGEVGAWVWAKADQKCII
jgi:hypothetical protein